MAEVTSLKFGEISGSKNISVRYETEQDPPTPGMIKPVPRHRRPTRHQHTMLNVLVSPKGGIDKPNLAAQPQSPNVRRRQGNML